MKTIIITGANRGIGFHCALKTAQMLPEKRIVLACRNQAAGAIAADKIMMRTGHQNVICLPVDLASLHSVRQFVAMIEALPDFSIEALINNAATLHLGTNAFSEDGFEITFATNHLGPFYLTLLLAPHYEKGARIIFVTSDTHNPARKGGLEAARYTDGKSLAVPHDPLESGLQRYSTSKLCNILTAYKLSEKFAHRNIRVNACNPGVTPGTGLANGYPPLARFIWNYVMPAGASFSKSAITKSMAGSRLARLAFSSQTQYLTGVYYSNGKLSLSSKDSYNTAFQEDLWNTSLLLTGLGSCVDSDQTN